MLFYKEFLNHLTLIQDVSLGLRLRSTCIVEETSVSGQPQFRAETEVAPTFYPRWLRFYQNTSAWPTYLSKVTALSIIFN
jgi:hypothetical protein